LDRLVGDILTVLHPALARLAALPVPVVTAINGSVGGAGLGLALCGDFAYASSSMKLRTGYAAIGLSPDAGSSYFLTRRVGATRAKQLFFLSDAVSAQQCLEWGIVDAVFPDEQLMQAAQALCARLAVSATGSIAAIKQLCDGADGRTLTEHLALEKTLLQARARSNDAREGVNAFLERRAARFTGG
jgi:2-(1,2-epoxy-1,2-dihydrophenyl)acetyl-CoA isomerase